MLQINYYVGYSRFGWYLEDTAQGAIMGYFQSRQAAEHYARQQAAPGQGIGLATPVHSLVPLR